MITNHGCNTMIWQVAIMIFMRMSWQIEMATEITSNLDTTKVCGAAERYAEDRGKLVQSCSSCKIASGKSSASKQSRW